MAIFMKIRVLIIIGLILFTSISIAEANSLFQFNKNQVNKEGKDGRIYGRVETQGHDMIIGVPDLKVACGKNLNDYQIEITDKNGFFEFSDLDYEDTGTKYFIWILPGQNVIFPGIKTVELNDENTEGDVYYFVMIRNSEDKNKAINNFINQKIKNLVFKLEIEMFKIFFQ
jgi:hypothetical protein